MQLALVRDALGLKNHRVEAVGREDGRITVELERIRGRWLPARAAGPFAKVRDRLPERR